MKKRRRWICFLVGIGVLWAAAAFMLDHESRIPAFVIRHREDLEEIAVSCLRGDDAVEKYRGVKVEGVYSGEHEIVQFLYFAFGLVPSTRYYGFYYSQDDVPVPFQNAGAVLSQVSEGEWNWYDAGTDNGGRTKRITDHWFYYEAWF